MIFSLWKDVCKSLIDVHYKHVFSELLYKKYLLFVLQGLFRIFFHILNQSMLLWNSAAKCSACGHFFSDEKMLNTIKLLNFNRNGSVKRGPNNSRSVLFLQSDNKYFSICVLFLQTSLNPYPWGQSHHLRLQNHQTRAENLIRNVSVDNSLFFFNVTESYKLNC